MRRCSAAQGPLHKGGSAYLRPVAVQAEGRQKTLVPAPALLNVAVRTLLALVSALVLALTLVLVLVPMPVLELAVGLELVLPVQLCVPALLRLEEAAQLPGGTRDSASPRI